MAYPDHDAPYSTDADEAWLKTATAHLKWEAPSQGEGDDVVGHITGACPRCGHSISTTISGVMVGVVDLSVADQIPQDGVAMICDCGAVVEHKTPEGERGCGAGFQLSAAEVVGLDNFPR